MTTRYSRQIQLPLKNRREVKSRNFPLALRAECGLLAVTRRLNPLACRNRIADKAPALSRKMAERRREREREGGRFGNGPADYTVASEKSHPSGAALPFERNLVISKRRLLRQTSSGPLQRPIWNTFLDPDQLPTVRIPHEGSGRGGAERGAARRRQRLKNLEGALNRLNGIPLATKLFSPVNS